MTLLVMRPSRLDDFDDLMELAELSGPGFTSLPVDEELVQGRLEASQKAFSRQPDAPQQGKFLMMMEDVHSGTVAGCCAVKSGIGMERPFFNYRIITILQSSTVVDRRFSMDALVLTNEFMGYTEVGTLFLKKEFRGGGSGRLAAQSRYLLMAAAPDEFGDMVLAELRGVVTEDGISPFWEGVGRRFFNMSFQDADYHSGVTDGQFIMDLMPKYPIYVDLLSPEAREVIGRCHVEGIGAMKLLEWEGFRFERVVDIFDGGPQVSTARSNIRTIRESQEVIFEEGPETPDGPLALVSNDELNDFRVCWAHIERAGKPRVRLSPETMDALKIKPGHNGRIWVKDAK
ncbi:MAG: arginine N-succinyltransferase [Ponticaulis sp.]|nr:arginine N-succinyltransferase [Ponticaulis sp.]|tara:strand:- start:47012 stop:48043 length:1032 start_codon:yes stop_codon:yes gene_type:complete